MNHFKVREVDNDIIFFAKIVPGSSSPTKICGLHDGMLKVKVSSPPEKGKANQCLIQFLASKLDIKKSAIDIISGQTNPIKQIQISGISIDTLLRRFNINAQDFYK